MNIPCPNCGRLNRPGARYCATCRTPLDATAAHLQQGQSLDGGAYRVIRPLDRGGMGAVWLVAQTKAFDRLAVLKEVIEYFDPTDADARRKALERFEAEARTLGDLKHPGIPDLYAYFTEGGHNYLVMEYIEGPDLRKWLTHEDSATGQLVPGAPLADDDVLRYTIQVCEVLEYLARHRPPVVHNDIKPENIIVDEHSGRAVLVDFGTAKPHPLLPDGRPDERTPSIYGTVGYAAPELYQDYAEPRSDVYSLAATAYCLLTGDDPRAHPFQYPHLTTQTLPPALTDILRAALAHEVGDRLTVTQFRRQLQQYAAGQDLVTASRPGDAPLAPIRQRDSAEFETSDLRPMVVKIGQRVRQEIEVTNRGQGYLRGEVRSNQPWLKLPGSSPRFAETGARAREVNISTFACPPGQTHAVPIEIDTTGLEPGLTYMARVTLAPTGRVPKHIPVIVTIAREGIAPVIQVTPSRLDFGTLSQAGASVVLQSFIVTNEGQVMAQCDVRGIPRWLRARPRAFCLVPGARQEIEIGLIEQRIPGQKQQIVLTIAVEGGQDQKVYVSLQMESFFSSLARLARFLMG